MGLLTDVFQADPKYRMKWARRPGMPASVEVSDETITQIIITAAAGECIVEKLADSALANIFLKMCPSPFLGPKNFFFFKKIIRKMRIP